MISVTNMTMEDFKSIEPILTTDFDDFWNPETLKSELLNKDYSCFVAKNNIGEILGFANIWNTVDDIHITNIVVRKISRKQGIGTLLLKKLIEISNKPLTLEVKHTNIPAIKFYSKHGFKNVGIRKSYYDNTHDAIIMTRERYK